MIRLLRFMFGSYCDKHDQSYRSDFCPQCVRLWEIRADSTDRRRIAKSEAADGAWPIKKGEEA